MPRRPVTALLPAVVLLALPSGASAIGMTDSYPREVASTGTGEGVRLTRMQASVRTAGARVRVTVRLAGASVAGTRRLTIGVARCTVTTKKYPSPYDAPDAPSRPTCRPGSSVRTVRVSPAPFFIRRTFTLPRPARRPGALRVQVHATGSAATIPPCTGYADICAGGGTGDLLLNGNTWTYRPGTWWGITATPPDGVTVDRVLFRSRMGGWTATSAADARAVTTWGYEGEPPAKTMRTPMRAGIQTTLRVNSAFGGEFQTRTSIRVLDYGAAIDGRRLFTVTLPLPVWHSPMDVPGA